MTVSASQLDIIEQQLGRPPRGIVAIVAQTEAGVPLVLQMRSLVGDQPFPTLYWLCSKDLCKAIGQIEGRGWIKEIEGRLKNDNDLHASYQKDQQRYMAQRQQNILAEDKNRIEELGLSPVFERYGIGGITQLSHVRCLHMQYAQHLVDGNSIGSLMDEQFELDKMSIQK